MKKLLKFVKYPLILALLVSVGVGAYLLWPVSGAVYAGSFGVIADDGIDDTEALNAAIEDLKLRGGGKLILPSGQIIVSDRLYFNTYGNYTSYDIVGDGSEILVNGDAGKVIFYFGNNGQVRFDGLTFVGRNVWDPNDPTYIDCGYLIFANYVEKLTIVNTQFIGIRANVSIVYTGLSDTVIENSNFGGSSGRLATVEAGQTDQFDNWFRGLTVRNTTFLDYGNYRNTNYWKSSSDNSFWIKAVSSVEMRDSVNAIHQRLVRIEDCRFDEAATVAVAVWNAEFLKIEGIMVNVNSTGGGRALDLSGVHLADVNYSRFGFTSGAKPAIKATNGSNVAVRGMTLGGGVIPFTRDSTSVVTVTNCFGANCRNRSTSSLSDASTDQVDSAAKVTGGKKTAD